MTFDDFFKSVMYKINFFTGNRKQSNKYLLILYSMYIWVTFTLKTILHDILISCNIDPKDLKFLERPVCWYLVPTSVSQSCLPHLIFISLFLLPVLFLMQANMHIFYFLHPCLPQFRSVQSLSRIWLFAASLTALSQVSLSITNSQSMLKLMSIKSVMPSNHLILCTPLLHQPSNFPSIRVFSNESVLHIR